MIAIIDYGIGNLFSVVSSFKYIGQEAVVTSDPEVIKKSDKILLPGVGAFGDAIEKLRQTGLDKVKVSELEKYMEEEQFAKGSKLPKINACINIVQGSN